MISAAEESTAWPGVSRPTYLGGLGFGFKWNMGWMHDTLGYFQQDPVYRRYHHHELTFSLMYAFSENFILPLSHDEVVHGKGSLLAKMPGDRWQKLANLRALYAYMWSHPGKKLLFMGQEFGQDREWSHERSLDWHLLEDPGHGGVQALVRDLNHRYRELPALWQRDDDHEAFGWLEANDADANVLAFVRWGDGRLQARRRASPTSRRCRARATASGCRARAPGPRCSTPTPASTAAPTSGTWAASRPTRSPGTTSRSRPPSRCRRWAWCGWCRPRAGASSSAPISELRPKRPSPPTTITPRIATARYPMAATCGRCRCRRGS